MRALTFVLIAGIAATTGGCADTYDQPGYASDYRSYRQYDYNRPDPRYNGYYADQYYVDNPRYRERRLSRNDRIYAGRDGRYYCRRSDGTTGLIAGAALGGLLGNALSNGRSATFGTLLGVAGGAALGSSIDRGRIQCR